MVDDGEDDEYRVYEGECDEQLVERVEHLGLGQDDHAKRMKGN